MERSSTLGSSSSDSLPRSATEVNDNHEFVQPTDDVGVMEEKVYKEYSRRWLVLSAIDFCLLSNTLLWLTFAPVVYGVANLVDVSTNGHGLLGIPK